MSLLQTERQTDRGGRGLLFLICSELWFFYYLIDPSGPTKQGHSLKLPASQSDAPPPPPPATPNSDKPTYQKPNAFQPAKSCSHCSIPTTTKAPQLTDIASVSQEIQPPLVSDNNIQNYPPQYNENTNNSPQDPQYSQNPQQNNYDNVNNEYSNQPNNPSQPSNPNDLQNYDNQYNGEGRPENEQQGIPSSGRNPKQYFDAQEPNILQSQVPQDPQDVSLDSRLSNNDDGGPVSKPVLLSAQMQIVDRNTDVHQLNPGEREGLPNGLNKDDMGTLLYTFNYTVGFHGHHEEGYTNGVKKGYYFITGRNGIKTRVDYIADDTGFHPKISQEVLDVLSDDVPKPETEKDAKYGLKGYEFKWLYFPQDSRR